MIKKIFLFLYLTACLLLSYFPLVALQLTGAFLIVFSAVVLWAFYYSFFQAVIRQRVFFQKINFFFLLFFFLSIGVIQLLFALVAFQKKPEMVAGLAAVFSLLFLCAVLFYQRVVMFIILLSFMSAANSYIFMYIPSALTKEDAVRIAHQKEVLPLFWLSEKVTRRKGKFLGGFALPKKYGAVRVLFMDSHEKHLYCVLHGPPAPRVVLLKFNVHWRNGRFVLDKNYLSIRADMADKAGLKAAFLDEENKKIYAASTQGKLLVIDSESLKILKELDTDMTRLMQLYWDKKRGRILVFTEDGNIKSYLLPELMGEKRSVFQGNPYAVFPDPAQKYIYIVQGGKGTVVEFDLDAFEVTRDYKSSAFFPMGAYMDYSRHALYITDYFFGKLRILDTRDFMETDSFKIHLGVRELAVDKLRGLIYVGQFKKGLLYVLRLGEKKIFKEIFLGTELRHIYMTPRTHQVLVATAYGVFCVDADKIKQRAAVNRR